MSSKINNTFSSYMLAFLMPSRALRHADASRLTQKGLGAHSSSKLDTHAALAKIRGVPSLAPPCHGAVVCSEAGSWRVRHSQNTCTCHAFIVVLVGSCRVSPVGPEGAPRPVTHDKLGYSTSRGYDTP